ncbi:heterokaryon incompatibility protein-domain-containing protein [Halenospora varia]|nr:heterokaryon incompatibility protein-domain-containing protein [Halenospora varia]
MENRRGQTREPGDFDDQYLNRQSCFCQPLHSGCDPKFCDKAVLAPLSEWIEHSGPLRLFEIGGQWEKGAAEGCMTCGAILAAGEQVLKLYKQDLHHLSNSPGRNAASSVSLAVKREPGKFQVSKDTNIVDFVQLFKKPGFRHSSMTKDSASTESDAAFDFCKVRLQRCIETHTACQKRCLYRYPLPKRVIDIGYRDQKLGDGQGDSFHPYLFELGYGQSLEYVTLSHCWGQKQIITTTKTTLASRLQIYITHKLGYRYIWIDSLCIIQDDELDWQTESKNMASTYQNSVFTIAASKSANGNGGCFTSTPGLIGEELYHPYIDAPTGINWRQSLMHLIDPLLVGPDSASTTGSGRFP